MIMQTNNALNYLQQIKTSIYFDRKKLKLNIEKYKRINY